MRKILAPLGLPSLTSGVAVPAAAVCSTGPMIAVAGLGPAVFWTHLMLPLLAPVNLVVLWLSFRRHRKPTGLAVASLGVLLIVTHFVSLTHFSLFFYIGVVLLVLGALFDWRVHRRPVRSC